MDSIRDALRNTGDKLFNFAKRFLWGNNNMNNNNMNESSLEIPNEQQRQQKRLEELEAKIAARGAENNFNYNETTTEDDLDQEKNLTDDDDANHTDALKQTLRILQEAVDQEVVELDEANADVKQSAREESAYNLDENRGISYKLEMAEFMDRNTPAGFSNKMKVVAPFLAMSFVSWPTYWLYRGYNWHHRRGSERLGIYIQKTFQRAKFMQIAILTIALLMATKRESSAMEIKDLKSKRNKDN